MRTRSTLVKLIVLTATAALFLWSGTGNARATATFVVNDLGDAPDAAPGNTFCLTAGGVCTLRAAIQESNALAGTDTINFAVGVLPTISPTSPLPMITGPTNINGNTGGATRVEISGASAGFGAEGLNTCGSVNITSLVINRFASNGIHASCTERLLLTNSYIGTDTNGIIDLGNGGTGVVLEASFSAVDHSVISGNGIHGIQVGSAAHTVNTVFISQNIIGLDAGGTVDLGNGNDGIITTGTIDSVAALYSLIIEQNTVSGNDVDGIGIAAGASDVKIQGNKVGLNVAGTAERRNGSFLAGHGIVLAGTNTDVFPSGVMGPNVIAGHGTDQIFIVAGSSGTKIRGNYIGTDVTGNNGLGSQGPGIVALGSGAYIGDFGPGDGNVISGNGAGGIRVGGGTLGTQIRRNKIGVGADDVTLLGNGPGGPAAGTGVFIQGSQSDVTQNHIAGNWGDGIRVNTASATANTFDGNSIHDNIGLGIELIGALGPDANDVGDPDSGPNNLQNYPVITSAKTSGTNSEIKGTLNSTPSTSFVVELFSNASCDPSGFGEGRTFIGGVNVTTDGLGNGSFTYAGAGPLALGEQVTATARRGNETSEFSACQFISSCGADSDCDGFADVPPTAHQSPANPNTSFDNCPGQYNPAQLNGDGNLIDLSPPKAFDDLSAPYSDALGDDCDIDRDNDGRSDVDEFFGISCAQPTDPFDPDTDGDNYLDGAECTAGTDPTNVTSKPTQVQCNTVAGSPVNTDADADGVLAFREACFYNTDPNNANTDGDACNDGREVGSINANSAVDVIDLQQVASEASGSYSLPGSNVKVAYDMTKNASIDVLDLQFVAARVGSCP